jgi:transitional endoplasmic reticulum ATPase
VGDAVFEGQLRDGIAAFECGDFRLARKHLYQAHLREPDDPRVRFWLAAAQYHLGNAADALPLLEAALDAPDPPVPQRPAAVYEYLCRCWLGRDAKRALEVAEEGLRRDADDPRMRLVAGNACFRLERFPEALAHYDAAWRAEGGRDGEPAFRPHPGQVPFARSSALVQLGRWKEALAAVDDALAREPKNAAYHNRRAMISLDGLGDAAAAAESARRAIEIDPDTLATGGDGVYYWNLAQALRRLGQIPAALAAIERGIAISPSRRYTALRDELAKGAPTRAESAPAAAAARVDFSKVGGMKALKEQARDIIEVVHLRRDEARRYGIVRNGILLYGQPGCGKTFFAEALAGEFGLNFLRVPLGSATSKWLGGAAEAMEAVFADARRRVPCLLFFDELDAIGSRRDATPALLEQQTTVALLQQIDAHRDVPGLVLAAATNRLEELDPAVIREGRFDYKVKVYRPDFDARREILETLLRERPYDGSADLARLAEEMEGFSAARIRHALDLAAMAAMESGAAISEGHLRAALREQNERARPPGARLGWDDLVLPEATKGKLRFIERFIEHPAIVKQLGVEAPTGVLLYGPPGTGKTTVARVLAAQTDASFHPINAADIFSKWLGDSERKVRELFEAARDRVPAIIFIDEVEAVLGRRLGDASEGGRAVNAVVNTFLAEMDGIESSARIFVLGATNRPDLLDEAVLRPGRFGEAIEIGLPDAAGREAMLRLHAKRMRLAPDVDFARLAVETGGASGADLRGLCTAAGRRALLRAVEAQGEAPAVSMRDFVEALPEMSPRKAWEAQRRAVGFVTQGADAA